MFVFFFFCGNFTFFLGKKVDLCLLRSNKTNLIHQILYILLRKQGILKGNLRKSFIMYIVVHSINISFHCIPFISQSFHILIQHTHSTPSLLYCIQSTFHSISFHFIPFISQPFHIFIQHTHTIKCHFVSQSLCFLVHSSLLSLTLHSFSLASQNQTSVRAR